MNGAGHGVIAPPPDASASVADQLAAFVAGWTGHRPDAIRRTAIARFVEATLDAGATAEDICERARRRDPALTRATLAAVTVGETFFFRQHEHFRWIARSTARWAGDDVRAWSAGCATGEEAYSLAACLAEILGPCRYTVLGTDLVEENLERARAGLFGGWSLRTSAPTAFPLFERTLVGGARPYAILSALRERVRFERHNLLDPPPPCPGGFHVILCRNVLLYFTPEAARTAAARLAGALAPNGVLVFGPLDIGAPPDGFCRVGPPELNVFERASARHAPSLRAPRRPSLRATPRKPSGAHRLSMAPGLSSRIPGPPERPEERAVAAAPADPNDPQAPTAIALHRRLLTLVEHGQRPKAERLLAQLRATAPDYLPGLLEEGLFHARAGRRDRARLTMDELARRCERFAADAVVQGPEDLSIEYYRIASRSFGVMTGDGPPRPPRWPSKRPLEAARR